MTAHLPTPPKSGIHSLRTRFALAMGASGLLLGVFATGVLEWRLEHTTYEALHHTLKITSDQIAGQLANDLATRRREIQLTGTFLQKSRLSPRADIRALFDDLKRQQPSYAWIGLTDRNGKVIAASDGLLEGKNVAERPWFAGARNGLYLGEPHEAKLLANAIGPAPDGEPPRFVDVAIALKDAHGQVQGILAAHLHWHWVKSVVAAALDDLDPTTPVQVLIADRQGKLLLKPDSEPATSLAALQPEGQPGPGFLTAQSRRSANELSEGLGWTVLARQDMRQIQAPILAARDLMLLFSVAGGIAFLLLTWRLAARVARPITTLADEARAYSPASGEALRSQVSSRADEVGLLGRVIEELVEGLLLHAGRTALFVEHAPAPLAIFDTGMRYVAASQRWLADYGLEGRSVVGQSHYDLFPEIPDHWRQIHQRALAGEVLHSDRECFTRADGRRQWLRWEARPWRTPAQLTGGIVIFSEDITERVLTEQALQQSEQRFRATFEQAAVGIAHVSLDGHWLHVNRKLSDIVGYPPEELLSKTFQDITHPDDLSTDLEHVARLLRGELDQYHMEKRYLRKDGRIVWIHLTASLVRDSEGQPAYFVSVVEDIDARKQAEGALHEQDQMLNDMSAMAHVGGWAFDTASGQGTWTPECARIHDLPEDAPINVAAGLDYFIGEHRQIIARAVEAASTAGTPYDLELEIRTATGRHKWIRTIGHPVVENGRVVRVFGAFQDITAHKEAAAALAASHQRFAGIVASAMDAIISIDARGCIKLFNAAAEVMFGTSAESALGSSLERFIPERFRGEHAAHVARFGTARATSRGMGRLGEVWGLRSDGSEFPIEAAISQVEVDGEKLYTVILRDIGTRLAAEQEIREREALFRGFFEASSVGSAVLDAHGRYVAVNDCYCAMLGYAREELLAGRGPLDVTHPEDVALDRERVGRLLRGEAAYDYEKRFVSKTGEVVWGHVSATAVRNAAGEIEAIVGVAQDISLRRQAAEAMKDYQVHLEAEVVERTRELTATRNYFRDFVLRAPLALCVVDAEGRIVVRNEQFVNSFGYDERTLPTMDAWWPHAYPDPAYRAWAQQTWEAALAQAQAEQRAVTPIEYRVSCADGRVRSMEISGVMLDSGFLATFVDVTARREAEVELDERRAQAEAANQAKSDFLATMSHEIRTPMNAILGTAQILERADLPEDERQLVATIRTAGRSLLAVVNDVLDLSKIEAGRFELENSPFVLGNVMSNLIDVFTASAANKGLNLSLAPIPRELEVLVGDATRLGQVLHNLVGNAIKFTRQGAIQVSVTVLQQSAGRVTLRFAIHDSGVGIPAERLPHLFQAFVQADASTSRHFGGTGLGLAICRQLVSLMGGEIGVHSEEGEGSEFWFAVPFEKSALGEASTPGRRVPAIGPRLAGRHVLVADDSAINLDLARRLLALEGASCDTVADGRLAVERLREHPTAYDLVLMDVQMPGMDGLAATRAIRRELGLAGLPVIALTAGALPSQRERASAAGMNDFIAKPFELDTLVATILRYTNGLPPRPAALAPPAPAPAPTAGEFPAVPGIDGTQAARRLLGDKALFYMMLRALRDEYGAVPEQVRADLAQGELKNAARRLHKLRGAAGSLSALTVAARAAELEQLLDAGSTASLKSRLAALAGALDEILQGLPADLDAPTSVADETASLEPADLRALRDALLRHDMKALRLFAALRPQLAGRHGEAALRPLSEAIDRLDFSVAGALLDAWYPAP